MTKNRIVWWIRTDLRLHDNVALAAALELKPEVLYPVWTWDPHYVYHARVSPNRWRFLLDCQRDLSTSIEGKTAGKNGLLVMRGNPVACLHQAFKDWKITHLVFEQDTDTYAMLRDKKVMDMAESVGVKVIVKLGRTLYDPEALTRLNNGKAIYNISAVQKFGAQIGEIPRPLEAPKSIPSAGDTTLHLERDETVEMNPDLNAIQRKDGTDSVTCYERMDGPNGTFAVPTMEELNMKDAPGPHRGGEAEALRSLTSYLADKKQTATFEKPKTNPGVFLPPETTLLSPHLHFGSLSIRKFYWDVMDVVKAYGSGASTPPTSLEGQLLFRDMYFAAQYATDHYEQTRGNPHCRYIPWKLGNTYDRDGKVTGYDTSDKQANLWFERWKTGQTGFPWIDAIMRQLARDGWIHHLARHSVACFLTRGHCYISWERGADVFEELLIDHETACNVGNWQWLSCTAFFSQFYRVYSPVAFGKKWDKTGALIREYVPELKDVPEKFIYEPWKMSIVDQKAAGVVIGQTYPKPMLDVSEQAKIALAGMKASYAAKIYGDDPRVLDGSAKRAIEGDPSPANKNDMPRKRKGEQGSIDLFAKKKTKSEPKEEHEDNEQDN